VARQERSSKSNFSRIPTEMREFILLKGRLDRGSNVKRTSTLIENIAAAASVRAVLAVLWLSLSLMA
jgi:hypothetical protein